MPMCAAPEEGIVSLPSELQGFLRHASTSMLEGFELKRLDDAAQARKEVTALLKRMAQAEAEALLASWIRELARELGCTDALQKSFQFVTDSGSEVRPIHRPANGVRSDTAAD